MGQTREQKIIRQISGTPTTQLRTPIATDMFLPNHSGVSDKSIKRLNDVRHTKYFSSIQAAIDDLPSTGGTVFVDAGTYTITSSITIPSNVSLIGEGKSSKIFLAANSNVDLIQNADTTLGNENIIIENLEIDGNSANQAATPEYSCIYFYKADNCKIRNCFIHDTISLGTSDHRGCCVFLDDSDNNQISGCTLYGGGYDNITIRNASHGNIVYGNTSHDAVLSSGVQSSKTTKNGIAIAYDNIVKGNVCYDNNNNGVVFHFTSNCIADSNICYGNGQIGVHLVEGCHNCIATSNVCYGNADGIRFQDGSSDNCIIANNNCFSNTRYGIDLLGSDIVVVGNHCYNNTTANIRDGATRTLSLLNYGYTGDKLQDHDLTTTGDITAGTYSVGASAGADGSFTTTDGKTVTVTKGIITSIV